MKLWEESEAWRILPEYFKKLVGSCKLAKFTERVTVDLL